MEATALYTGTGYLDKNPDWHVGDSAWKAGHVQAMLIRHNLRPATVAEVGCGAGEILRTLHSVMPKHVRFDGYEVSPAAYELCRTRRTDGLEYHLADLLSVPGTFDLVLCMDVFEHVEDVFGFLRKLRTKGRHTIFHVPLDISAYSAMTNALARGRAAFGHIHYYNRPTALALLSECGYEVVDWFYTFGFQSPGQRATTLKRRAFMAAWWTLHKVNHELAARMMGAGILVLARSSATFRQPSASA